MLAIRDWILTSSPDVRSALVNVEGLINALARQGLKIVPVDQASPVGAIKRPN